MMADAVVPPGDHPKYVKAPLTGELSGPPKGHLVVSLKDGNTLAPNRFGGECDPYVRVLLRQGGVTQLRALSSVKNSVQPRWDEQFVLPVHDCRGDLVLQVLDHHSIKIRTDDVIGEAVVPIRDALLRTDTPDALACLPLVSTGGAAGRDPGQLEVDLEFVPTEGARLEVLLYRARALQGDGVANPATSIYAVLDSAGERRGRAPLTPANRGYPDWGSEGHVFDIPAPKHGDSVTLSFFRSKGSSPHKDAQVAVVDLDVRDGRLAGARGSSAGVQGPDGGGGRGGVALGGRWVAARGVGKNGSEVLVASRLRSAKAARQRLLREVGAGWDAAASGSAAAGAGEADGAGGNGRAGGEGYSGGGAAVGTPTSPTGSGGTAVLELSPGKIRGMSPHALEKKLSQTSRDALSRLDARQIASLSQDQLAAAVPYLSPAQLASVRPEQTAGYTAEQLRFLDGARLESVRPHLTPHQVASLPPDALGKFSPSGLSQFSPSQARSLEPSQLAGLRGGQLSAVLDRLTPTQVAAIPPSSFATLPPHKLFAMDVDQASSLSASHLSPLDPRQLTALLSKLEPRQISRVAPGKLAALSPSELDVLSTAQVRELSAQQLGAMSWEQLARLKRKLSDGQISKLDPNQLGNTQVGDVRRMSPYQLRHLSPLQLAEALPKLSAGQLAAVDPDQLAQLPPRAVQCLKPAILSALGASQVRALQGDQLDGMGSAQLAAILGRMSADQIGALGPAVLPQRMGPRSLVRLTPEQLEGMTPLQAARLTPEQLHSLSMLQLGAVLPGLPEKQVAHLLPRQVSCLLPAQLRSLTGDQVGGLRPRQLEALGPDELDELLPRLSHEQLVARVAKMPPAHLRALSLSAPQVQGLLPRLTDAQLEAVLGSLTPEQLCALPPARLKRIVADAKRYSLSRAQRRAAVEHLKRASAGGRGRDPIVYWRAAAVSAAAATGWFLYRHFFPNKRRYRIRQNDTLWRVTRSKTPKRYTVRKLVDENSFIENPDKIFAGDILQFRPT